MRKNHTYLKIAGLLLLSSGLSFHSTPTQAVWWLNYKSVATAIVYSLLASPEAASRFVPPQKIPGAALGWARNSLGLHTEITDRNTTNPNICHNDLARCISELETSKTLSSVRKHRIERRDVTIAELNRELHQIRHEFNDLQTVNELFILSQEQYKSLINAMKEWFDHNAPGVFEQIYEEV